MTDFRNFKGKAKRITDYALPRAAHIIGVGEDEIHAVIDVETNGSGFDKSGRPKMLFEPHVFYRNLKGLERDRAIQEGLAYPNFRPGTYPKDSYPRLTKAMAINETAALKSASWGLPQILGENYQVAGYKSPQAMVLAFLDDEEAHLIAMVKFIQGNKIDAVLRRMASLKRPTLPSDTVDFVRVYNGPRYAANNYHVEMAKAHNKWRAIKDTPFDPNEDLVMEPGHVDAWDEPKAIRLAQVRLRGLGYGEVGVADGLMGKRTRNAILAFQADNGIPLSGKVTGELLTQLEVAAPRVEVPARVNADAADLIEQGDMVAKSGNRMKKIGAAILAASGLTGLVDGVVDFDKIAIGLTGLRSVLYVFEDIPLYVWIAVGGAVILYFGGAVVKRQVAAFRTGRSV